MFKKITTMLLLVAMIISMSACGVDSNTKETIANNESTPSASQPGNDSASGSEAESESQKYPEIDGPTINKEVEHTDNYMSVLLQADNGDIIDISIYKRDGWEITKASDKEAIIKTSGTHSMRLRLLSGKECIDYLHPDSPYMKDIVDPYYGDHNGAAYTNLYVTQNDEYYVVRNIGWVIGTNTGFIVEPAEQYEKFALDYESLHFDWTATRQPDREYYPIYFDEYDADQIPPIGTTGQAPCAESLDDSTASMLASVILMNLQYEDVYNELIKYACSNNVSCYIDASSESDPSVAPYKIDILDDQGNVIGYTFRDETRKDMGEKYYAAGQMYGVTITFQPSFDEYGRIVLNYDDGIINKFVQSGENTTSTIFKSTKLVATDRNVGESIYLKDAPNYVNKGTLVSIGINDERSAAADQLIMMMGKQLAFETEKHTDSELTVFINFGVPDTFARKVEVYCQWNGLYLAG